MAVIPNPKDVRLLAEEIERLESQLAAARGKWVSLFGGAASPRGEREANPSTLTGRVEQFIVAHPDKAYGIGTVAEALGEPSLQVGRVLYRLQMDKRIRTVGRGRYQALEKEVPSEERTS